MSRNSIPQSTRLRILTECGYRCAVPTCRTILALDLHHIEEVEKGGGNEAINLLALCPTCHALFHRGTIQQASIRAWKAMIVAMSHAFDRRSLDDLLMIDACTSRLSDEPSHDASDSTSAQSTLVVSGDAILDRSALLGTGLIGAYQNRWGGRTGLAPSYTLYVTQAGRNFIHNWQSGDIAAAQRLLAELHSAIGQQSGQEIESEPKKSLPAADA